MLKLLIGEFVKLQCVEFDDCGGAYDLFGLAVQHHHEAVSRTASLRRNVLRNEVRLGRRFYYPAGRQA